MGLDSEDFAPCCGVYVQSLGTPHIRWKATPSEVSMAVISPVTNFVEHSPEIFVLKTV